MRTIAIPRENPRFLFTMVKWLILLEKRIGNQDQWKIIFKIGVQKLPIDICLKYKFLRWVKTLMERKK